MANIRITHLLQKQYVSLGDFASDLLGVVAEIRNLEELGIVTLPFSLQVNERRLTLEASLNIGIMQENAAERIRSATSVPKRLRS